MGNSAEVPRTGAKSRATLEPKGADELEKERLALERDRLRLERQKIAIDARLKRRELSVRRGRGWLETLASPLPLAIVGGFITLMTTIVTNFVSQRANLKAEQSRAALARESAKQQLQAELIKKFVESPKTETVRENLRFLVAAGLLPDYAITITTYLDANPGIAPQVGTPEVTFESSSYLSPEIERMLTAKLVDFSKYLNSVGFTDVDRGVRVVVEKMSNTAFVWYSIENNTVHVDYKLTGDIGVILREYSHHILVKDMTNISDNNCLTSEYAIAEYFSASYLDDPRIGITRDLSNTKILSDLNIDLSDIHRDDVTSISEVLAGALWETRSKLGHEPADRMIAEAWLQTGCTNKSLADFQRNLPKVVAARNGADLGHEIENLLRNRGFTG